MARVEKTSISLKPETRELLRRLAEQTGLSQSALVDMALMALQSRLSFSAEERPRPTRKKP